MIRQHLRLETPWLTLRWTTGPEVNMNTGHMVLQNSAIGNLSHPGSQQIRPAEREVLEELFQLLEEYAPTWYTEEHHNKAVAALLNREVKDSRRKLP
jgi:hypothetical protein